MNAFCILFTDTYDNHSISGISNERALGSIPFGGRYRLVDFILSSLVRASVSNIGVIARDKYSSLVDHLSSGKDWDLNRKNGGLKFITPFAHGMEGKHLNNEFEGLRSAMDYIDHMLPEYCVVADSNIVFNIDLKDVFNCHINKNADITVVYRTTVPVKDDLEITCSLDGKLHDALLYTHDGKGIRDVAMPIYIL